MDETSFVGPLLDEARVCIARGASTPAKLLLTRALVAFGEASEGIDSTLREDLAHLFLDVGEPEKAVYALGEKTGASSPSLHRRATYEAAAELRGGAAPTEIGSPFVRRVLRLPGFQPDEIRRTYREMAALLDRHGGADEKSRASRPPIVAQDIYTICMMPRSGSNFLVKCLTDTGVLGRPGEYLHRNEPTAMPSIVARFATATLDDVMAEVMARTRSPNGVFGIKVHIGMLLPLLVEGTFEHTLAHGKFIYTTRDDLLMQAISFVRAQMTGVWISKNEPHAEPHFDFDRIHSTIGQLSEMMTQWETFFALHGIQPLRLSYESINRDVDTVIARIADYLGIKLNGPTTFRNRRDTLQRDELNHEWRTRFLERIAAPTL